nr:MAG TPA: hypothetical protein [Caudoviricetes sp.]
MHYNLPCPAPTEGKKDGVPAGVPTGIEDETYFAEV